MSTSDSVTVATAPTATVPALTSPIPGVYIWPRPALFIGGLRLDRLSFITRFGPHADHPEPQLTVPTFEPKERPERRFWTPPDGTRLFIVFSGTPDPGKSSSASMKFIGLSLVDDQRAWMLPLPNQYEDGRFCIGDHVAVYGPTAQFVHAVYTAICETRFNKDLLRGEVLRRAQALFRWTSGVQQIVEDWRQYCTPYSNLSFNGLLELLIRAETPSCYQFKRDAFAVTTDEDPEEEEQE